MLEVKYFGLGEELQCSALQTRLCVKSCRNKEPHTACKPKSPQLYLHPQMQAQTHINRNNNIASSNLQEETFFSFHLDYPAHITALNRNTQHPCCPF